MNRAKDLNHKMKDSGIIIINLCKAEFSEAWNYLERLKPWYETDRLDNFAASFFSTTILLIKIHFEDLT